jgi:hypothetical protein
MWQIFRNRNVSINSPQSTTNSPQLDHKNTTQKTHFSQNTPQKHQQNAATPIRDHGSTFFWKITAEPAQ